MKLLDYRTDIIHYTCLNFGIKFCKMKSRNFVFIHGQREINSGIHKAAGLTVSRRFHDLPGTIPLFHNSNREVINGGTTSGGGSNWRLFWERLVTKEPAAL